MKAESWETYGKLKKKLEDVQGMLLRLEKSSLNICVGNVPTAIFLNAATQMHLRAVVLEGLKLTQRQIAARMEDL